MPRLGLSSVLGRGYLEDEGVLFLSSITVEDYMWYAIGALEDVCLSTLQMYSFPELCASRSTKTMRDRRKRGLRIALAFFAFPSVGICGYGRGPFI